eukprot:TRINITY_DN5570_c0_g5_i1.p1 TRINITY_DN5570_c0_g5~~TRINITY_DN5570_c0_g5_i1.p1  ORF type:complete len:391 (+),score=81.17 TRINITY_DN5570_c0_g5_i1:73-1173(+)
MEPQILFILFLLLAISGTFQACTRDEECFLNGVCTSGICKCDYGWSGENCSLLNLAPAPNVGAYGYSPNVSSWGGVPIKVGDIYHLYVAEMVDGCGLCTWGSNSRVVHATSDTLEGPYKFTNQALGVWSHNPEIAVDYSKAEPTYLLFHIGTGTGGNPRNCNGKKTHLDFNKKMAPDAGGVFHTSNSPYGPWEPQAPEGLPSNCNNPSPYVFPNGTIYLVCTWETFRASTWKGPWERIPFIFQGDGGRGNWEDPFIWVDSRGNWKLLSHVWISTGKYYAERVAGLAYSKDGINWWRSPTPPFTNVVKHVDGSESFYSTRERPKLFFDPRDRTTPLALFNGVGGVPGGDKDICGKDWTFTLVQPVLG